MKFTLRSSVLVCALTAVAVTLPASASAEVEAPRGGFPANEFDIIPLGTGGRCVSGIHSGSSTGQGGFHVRLHDTCDNTDNKTLWKADADGKLINVGLQKEGWTVCLVNIGAVRLTFCKESTRPHPADKQTADKWRTDGTLIFAHKPGGKILVARPDSLGGEDGRIALGSKKDRYHEWSMTNRPVN